MRLQESVRDSFLALWPLILIELANVVFRGYLRTLESPGVLLIVTGTISVVVLFAVGLLVVLRRIGGLAAAVFAALAFWIVSSLLGWGMEFFQLRSATTDLQRDVMLGLLMGSVLLIPVAAAIGFAGGYIAKRIAHST